MSRLIQRIVVWFIIIAAAANVIRGLAVAGQRWDIQPDMARHDHLSTDRHNWSVGEDRPAQAGHQGATFSVRAPEGKMRATWWKGGLDFDARMVSDGVETENKNGLILRIDGLAPGRHTLATYHNQLEPSSVTPLVIHCNGQLVAANIVPTCRVTHDTEATTTYFEFDVQETESKQVSVDVVITPAESVNDEATVVILNGFELDCPDPRRRAIRPTPAHGDEHVASDPTLRWTTSQGGGTFDVYHGTDRQGVADGRPGGPYHLGRLDLGETAVSADDPFAHYYWRVDRIDGTSITRGDIWHYRVRRLAFPGAEGYGRFAIGGRGGRVIKVANLNDDGPGSLRAAVEAEGPRTVVFDVSGRIDLKSRLIIRNPYLTIAGQTAPGKGICLSNYNLGMLGTHDVIIRHIRVRPGDTSGKTLDGMGMASSTHSIIDHCSISWTQDEAFSSRGAGNITLQRTLISEALNIAGHKKYAKNKEHGYAASIGGDVGSFHHNLLAHCAGRNWSLAGGLNRSNRHTGRLDLRNNLVYNWGHRTTDGGAMEVVFVNNYYKPGPATRVFHLLKPEGNPGFGPQQYYVSGNVMEGHHAAEDRLSGFRRPRDIPLDTLVVPSPFFPSHVVTESAEEARESVLRDVGCNCPMLDDHDLRVIQETQDGTATYVGSISGYPGLPDSQDDVGGWDNYPQVARDASWDPDNDGIPSAWEVLHGLDPRTADSHHIGGNHSTYLELYLAEAGQCNSLRDDAADQIVDSPFDGAKRSVYKQIGDVELTIDRFEPADHRSTDRRSAIVFFFGGGWRGGTVAQFVPHCEYLASRGMVAMVADYRVKSRHGTTPFDCVEDGTSAVRWIRQHASALGIDPNRIAAGGGSAGGHVAAATATLTRLDSRQEDLSVSSAPNALVLFNPVYDNGPDGYGYDRVKERFREISPMHNIRPGIPPTIVFLGTNDSLIPVETAKAFQRKMRDVGSISELHFYEGQKHGFFNHPRFRKTNLARYYVDTVQAMDTFLASVGFLEGPSTVAAPTDLPTIE